MMPWKDPDLDEFGKTVSKFVEKRVAPYQAEWELAGAIPRGLSKEVAKLGLLGAAFPEEVGGAGGDACAMTALAKAFHEVGGAGGVFSALFTTGVSLPHIIAAGNPAHIQRWVKPAIDGDLIDSLGITEPGGGSDVGGIWTATVREGIGCVINSEKTIITLGTRADFVVTAARTGGSGSAGVSLIVVPTEIPGFRVAKHLDKLGWRSSDTAELVYDNVQVPVDSVVGKEIAGFVLISQAFVIERLTMAARAYTTGERCLYLPLEWAKRRETFGQPLIARQGLQNALNYMSQKLDVSHIYTRDLATRWDRSTLGALAETPGANGSLDIVAHACFAKNTAAEAGEYAVYHALHLFGGLGCTKEAEVEMYNRDIRIIAIGGGVTEILTTLAASRLGMVG